MPIRIMPRSTAAAVALALSLCASGASAKVHPVFQKEIDRVCTNVGQANTAAAVRAIDQAEATRFARMAEIARRNATFFTDHITAKAQYEAADQRRHALDVDLSDRTTPARDTNLQERVQKADKAMAPIREKERLRDEALERIRTARIVRSGADVSRDQQIVDKLNGEIAREKPEPLKELQDAEKARDDNAAKIRQLRLDKKGVYDAVDAAKQRWIEAEKQYKQTVSLADELEETRSAIVDCIDRRLVAVDPANETAFLQRYLDGIERTIVDAERQLREANALCTQLPGQIQNLKGWAALVLERSRAAAALTAVDPALVQQHDRVVQDAINGANTAAAEIAQTRVRAQKAAADACVVAQAVEKDPRAADARARLAEAERHRAAAEKEVAGAAAELQRIRAAFAAATLVSAQLAAIDDKPTVAVSGLAGTLRQVKQWQAQLEYAIGTPTPWKSRTEIVGAALGWLTQQPKARDFVERHLDRIDKLRARHKALVDAVDCRTRFTSDIVAAAASVAAAEAQFAAIPAAAKVPSARPTQSPTTIEGIYNSARGVADGTATEATNAVRCVAAATNAVNNPPPPTDAGIKCRYKRPDGSTIEVTIFDEKTCPKDIPARFVDWKPEAKPDMMQGFGGKWDGFPMTAVIVEGETHLQPLTITGTVAGPPQPGITDKWQGTCQRTGTRTAKCAGSGLYSDHEREMTYTFELSITLSSPRSIDYKWIWGDYNNRMKGGRKDPYVAPGKGSGIEGKWDRI